MAEGAEPKHSGRCGLRSVCDVFPRLYGRLSRRYARVSEVDTFLLSQFVAVAFKVATCREACCALDAGRLRWSTECAFEGKTSDSTVGISLISTERDGGGEVNVCEK